MLAAIGPLELVPSVSSTAVASLLNCPNPNEISAAEFLAWLSEVERAQASPQENLVPDAVVAVLDSSAQE